MDERFKAFGPVTQLMGMVGTGKAKRALVALPPEPGLRRAFEARSEELLVWHHDYAVAAHDSGEKGAFSLLPPPGPFDLVLFYGPKSKEALDFNLDQLKPQLAEGARLLIAGPKTGGLASAKGRLEKDFEIIDKHAARHCVAWECKAPGKQRAGEIDQFLQTFEARAWDQAAKLRTLPGVFSHGRLDEGSALLLDHVDIFAKEFKRVLDWGCGSGVLGILTKLARRSCDLTLADSSAVALESAQRSLSLNALTGCRVTACDGWNGIEDNFDLILTNPPAHQGLAENRGPTERFLEEAPRHLRPGGRLILVANAHLPYLKILNESFKSVNVVKKTGRFQLIECRR